LAIVHLLYLIYSRVSSWWLYVNNRVGNRYMLYICELEKRNISHNIYSAIKKGKNKRSLGDFNYSIWVFVEVASSHLFFSFCCCQQCDIVVRCRVHRFFSFFSFLVCNIAQHWRILNTKCRISEENPELTVFFHYSYICSYIFRII